VKPYTILNSEGTSNHQAEFGKKYTTIVVVTGSASGIGKATCERLVKEDWCLKSL
jgi:NADP-dependent 3-hydroxy acid dehydrogenase YdfG